MIHMKYKNAAAGVLTAAMLIGLLAGCGASGSAGGQAEQAPVSTASVAETSAAAPEKIADTSAPVSAEINTAGATAITLSGTSAEIEGSGAAADGSGAVTITSGGTYILTGALTEGRVIVNAKGEDVTLVLNGVDITCSYGSPIYIYKAASATLHLEDGSENFLTDGAEYRFADEYSDAEADEPNACLYSKADLAIQGTGSLTVNGNYNNGITSKDTLTILDAAVAVNAKNNGVTGKDSADIANAAITIACGGDGLRSTLDDMETSGWITLSDVALDIRAGGDGVQAAGALIVDGGSYAITTGGGNSARLAGDVSAKGLKAGLGIGLKDGEFQLDCADDAVHSDGLIVQGGTYTIFTGDDAFHADATLTISGGEIDVQKCYEGLEGSDIVIEGGAIRIVSSDDGVNAGGGADGSGFAFGGWGRNESFGGGTSHTLTISGGTLEIIAGGDGLDSNGSIEMTGGNVIAGSTGNMDGALDYDGSFTITGGALLAAGGNMPEAPNAAEQNTVYLNFDTTLPSGSLISLTGGGEIWILELPVSSSTLIWSSDKLESGETYTVAHSPGNGGDWTQLEEPLTLGSTLTTYGRAGFGGFGGGRGGWDRNGGAFQPGSEAPEPPRGGRGQRPGGMGGGI